MIKIIYNVGFFFGRTRLIKLSPKKTWEGFLGAFVSTVIYGFIVSLVLFLTSVSLLPSDFLPCSSPTSWPNMISLFV